jgi:hypothetical protein
MYVFQSLLYHTRVIVKSNQILPTTNDGNDIISPLIHSILKKCRSRVRYHIQVILYLYWIDMRILASYLHLHHSSLRAVLVTCISKKSLVWFITLSINTCIINRLKTGGWRCRLYVGSQGECNRPGA